jgi:hypothetical protein
MKTELERILDDVQHGDFKKRSAIRLLHVLIDMAQRVEKLERSAEAHKEPTP